MTEQSPQRDPRDPRRPDRMLVYGAVAASMAVIVGLWLFLLPGQLNLSDKDSQSAPLWQRLRNDGQEAIDRWNQAFNQASDSLESLSADGQETIAPADGQQAEIDRFRDRLNPENIENSNSQ